MPKFIYVNETYDHESSSMREFIGPYPGPKLFKANKLTPSHKNVWSSNTIMAIPYHASAILELFYLSNQTSLDVESLTFFYGKLLAWQNFLHDRVIKKCIEMFSTVDSEKNQAYQPCIVVNHPWETEIDMHSPILNNSLNRLNDEVLSWGWSPSFEIPEGVKTFDYPGDEAYTSLLYLLDCLSNKTSDDVQDRHMSSDNIQAACPFSMIDVGFTAALAKSDEDLRQIQQILSDKNRISYSQREAEIAHTKIHTSKQMLNALWNEPSGIYFNRVVSLQLGYNGRYSSNKTTELDDAVAYNFMGMWTSLANATRIAHMTTQMIQRSGNFSYGCGEYPLWSVGGCTKSNSSGTHRSSPRIFPLVNYRIATGLKRNGAGMQQYIQTSTLNLICGTANSDESNLTNCNENLLFASTFDASTHRSLGKSACGLTSTLTASIVLDLLSADKTFSYDSSPPISNSSIIFLIAVEMIIAMAIGLSCLILSLNLVRRANIHEDGDKFFNVSEHHEISEQELLIHSPGLSSDYNTPVDTFDGAYDQTGFQLFTWSHDILSRFNPMNILREVHLSNNSEDACQQMK